ncbi:MAG: IS30 family transposase [Bacillota bacterium]
MSYHHLTSEERQKLSEMLEINTGIRAMARVLGRSPSTISRELKRNGSVDTNRGKEYFHINAQEQYLNRIHTKRSGKYKRHDLVVYIRSHLLQTWSPEQVAGRIKRDYPDDINMRISHSTIYRWLHLERMEQAAAVKLRRKGRSKNLRKPRYPGIRLLKERCVEAYRRQRIGDWELDTIVSAQHSLSGLLTMCDRKSRYCMLFFMRNVKNSYKVFDVLATVSDFMPCLTVTVDQGVEFSCYRRVENELNIPFYFCSPHSPWQKGSVENLNGLVREFFPKGTNFSAIHEKDIKYAMDILNSRPRKCLDWATPAEILAISTS